MREPLAAVAGGDDAVAGAFEQQADGGLHRRVVVGRSEKKSRSAGRNGFCRLETAPSLVAMVRKSGRVRSEEIGRPEMTMIGICGRCWRTIRMVSNPSIPGMKMSRNSRSKSPVWHNAKPFRPSPAVTTLWPARSSNRRTVIWTAASSSTTSILAKVKVLRAPLESDQRQVASFAEILVLLQLLPRQERSGRSVKKRDNKTLISACCRADNTERRASSVIRRGSHAASRGDQLLRYSG